MLKIKMKEQFVPYPLALQLKELGFDEKCLMFYEADTHLLTPFVTEYMKNSDSSMTVTRCISAPLWQQAFDFIIKKYHLVGCVYACASGWLYEIHDSAEKGGTSRYDCDYDEGDCELSGAFTNHYKARHACLTKLIELCKKN